MEKFEFKSQICTSAFQSERLLALGLKKETADCVLPKKDNLPPLVMPYDKASIYTTIEIIPAWSLYRLIEMIDNECVIHLDNFTIAGRIFEVYDNLFDNIISCIEWLIKERYFNKEYLV